MLKKSQITSMPSQRRQPWTPHPVTTLVLLYLMVWDRARIPSTKKYMESRRLMYSCENICKTKPDSRGWLLQRPPHLQHFTLCSAAAVSVLQGDEENSWNNPNSCTADGKYVGNSRLLTERAQQACELSHIYSRSGQKITHALQEGGQSHSAALQNHPVHKRALIYPKLLKFR